MAEVIIVGGGPVGLAFGLELGRLGIETKIYEKYAKRLIQPRAQLINSRSMEFFRRWGINKKLVTAKLLPADYPMTNIWCSGFKGKVYASVNFAENINDSNSPEQYHRIPLWITESIMQEGLKNFANVELINDCEITNILQNKTNVRLTIKNRNNNTSFATTAKYVIGCDGAQSFTRNCAGVTMQEALAPTRVLNVVFQSKQLAQEMTIPRGVLYYNLTLKNLAAIGCIDYLNGLWYAQLVYPENKKLEQVNVSQLLDQVAGFEFSKKIINANFWLMQAQIADSFRHERIFLAGDAAHILPPTGGHGLNTGLGDAVNLAWKLAAKLKGQTGDDLLATYEIERRSIALRNINAAKKNALDAMELRKKYPPEISPEKFTIANQEIAKQHTLSHGVALGYCYQNSPIIFNASKNYHSENYQDYQPLAEPGYFAPHCLWRNNESIYDYFTDDYILLYSDVIDKMFLAQFNKKRITLKILEIPATAKKIYAKKYYLIRPDWHIAWASNELPKDLENFINKLMPPQNESN